MIYLALNIVFSSFFILCIQWARRRGEDIINVGACNYISAALLGILIQVRSAEPLEMTASLLGSVNGACYFIAFFFLIALIGSKGATNVAATSRLSILMPIVYGVTWWGERPDGMQTVGILLACCSLVLISGRKATINQAEVPRQSCGILLMFFLAAGIARTAQEMFKYTCDVEQQAQYVAVGFSVAGVASLILMAIRRKRLKLSELSIGLALGTANMLQVLFVLKSLEFFDGFIVFPVTSAGGLAFTTLAAVTLLGERPSRLSYTGITIAIVSLALL